MYFKLQVEFNWALQLAVSSIIPYDALFMIQLEQHNIH